MDTNLEKPIEEIKKLISLLTPTNIAEEKEKYFSSSTYNPHFTYIWDDQNLYNNVLKIDRLRDLFKALKLDDGDLVKNAASILFDTQIDAHILSLAQHITTNPPPKRSTPPIEKIVASFESAFKQLGLNEYKVEVVDKLGFNFRPSGKEKKVVMSKYANFEFFSLDGEIKHELVHVIRYENGHFNKLNPAADYLPTEEGLACFSQDYTNSTGSSSLFQHAAEYMMTTVSLSGSLRQVIDFAINLGFSKELAWQRAIRHKFGFKDTSLPGDILKPAMYFYHEEKIKALNTAEKYRLFNGKISINQLKENEVYKGRISLETLKDYYSL